jgi:hypothetical protein
MFLDVGGKSEMTEILPKSFGFPGGTKESRS